MTEMRPASMAEGSKKEIVRTGVSGDVEQPGRDREIDDHASYVRK
jgi:hypothetical protein